MEIIIVAIRIPGTDKIIFVPQHIGDIVVNLGNYPDIDDTIRFEDVKILGNWTDYSGSGTKNPGEVMRQGIGEDPSTLQGQLSDIEIEKTDRGINASSVRQRPRLVTIEVK